jgi:hypothetical protein
MVRRVVRALVAAVALSPIVLVAGCGSGKPKPKAPIASTPATTSTGTTPARSAKPHAKAAPRHHHAHHAVAAEHTHHANKASSTKTRSTATNATPTTASTTTTSAPQSTSTPSSITFDLLGRSGDATSSVCGAPRHYHTYQPGETLGISGRVRPIPSARWKVKVKVEVCSGATFTDLVKIEATINKHTGTFTGSFPAPAAGFYRARAELYINDVRTVDSTDEHFETR